MSDQPKNPKLNDDSDDSIEQNPAVDGLVREYARTGGAGDDEKLVQSIMKQISGAAAARSKATVAGATQPVVVGRPERDLPWLFGKRFWKVSIAIALVFAVWTSGNTWFIETAQADPTEVMLFTRPRFAPGDDANLRVLVRDGRNKTPVANAEVSVVLMGADAAETLAPVKTDADGIADITAELSQELKEGEYSFRVRIAGRTGTASAKQSFTVARSYRTMVSTDKPLYQPGQIIHMRALSLNVDSMTPAKQRAVEFTVRDGKGNKVFAAKPKTSDFGIAAADFKLADQVNEGDYQVSVTVGDTTSERTVKVQNYVLPKFRIGLKTDRNYYGAGDEVTVTLNADYLFGKPTAGADVRIEAADMIAGRNVFQTMTGKTNAEGLFEATFKLKNRMAGNKASGGDAELFLTASVTDKAGETNKKTLSRIVAKTPIRIEVFPESGELVPGVENTLFVMTAFPDGSPAKTTVTTKGGTTIETNEVGIGKVKLTPKTRRLQISLTARDEATGVEASVVKNLRVGHQRDNVLLRTDRAIYKQGETANLTVLSGSPARRAFVDIIRNGRSVATTAIDLTNNQGQYALDLPSDVLGTVQVQAYCIQPNGRIARDTKVIQVQRANGLKITATLDAETYKPAEKAMIKFLVQSQNGDPVEAALSLAIVDEAVFAMNDARPGLEDMYFLIQEELLKPRYQFITQPRAVTGLEVPGEPAAQEADVVRFSAAEATDADAPDSARGESLKQRQQVVERTKQSNRRGLVRLLGTVPFTIAVVVVSIFLLYVLSRLVYRATKVEPAVAREFRSEMRLLYWISVVATVALPIVGYFATEVLRYQSPWIPVTVAVAALVGIGMISAPVIRIRRLLRREGFAPLFARMAWLIPAAYGVVALLFCGMAVATRLDRGAFRDPNAMLILLGPIGLGVCLGCLGFLRRNLTEPLRWHQNLLSLFAHQSVGMVALGILLFSVALAGDKTGARFTSVGELVDVATNEMAPRVMMAEAASREEWAAEADGLPGAWYLDDDIQFRQGSFEIGDREAPRIRRFFPETLLWQPQLLTDDAGKAQLDVQLADSITEWRLAGSAVDAQGRFGSFQQGIRVFQDFFVDIQMPVQLTQNDEISIPIAIFNYLSEPQTIALEISEADWFELVDDESTKSVEAAASEVLKSTFRIRVLKPGRHAMTITAKGNVLSDAVERVVRVEPDGIRRETVANAKLAGAATETITIPDNAVAGGNDLFVKLYPGGFSQVVEGMDSIFQMPHGCFEQTSSTTYPNVLVLNYLRETKQSNAAIEMKALDYIATGYQRLLSFEVDGGGFDWFGNPPANEVLTAYGLHEFIDMARVYEIDAEMVARTQQWLLSRMQPDGTFNGEDLRHERTNDSAPIDRRLRQTAYVTWALARAGAIDSLGNSIEFLEEHARETQDAYVMAMIANAMIACDRADTARDIIARLSDMPQQDDTTAYWTSADAGLTYGYGESLSVETTAIVIQAMMKTDTHQDLVAKGLEWLTSKRDARGTWHSTQATVQAMRALLMSDSSGRITQDTTVTIKVNGEAVQPLTITEETGDVFHLVSLTDLVRSGENQVQLTVDNDSLLAYQLVGVHYLPRGDVEEPKAEKLLQIASNYGKRELSVDDLLTVKVILRYNRPENAPMTLVDLGVPPGFEIDQESFRDLVTTGVLTKYEAKGPQVSLYFDKIPGGGKPTKFEYRLRAVYPVKAQAPASVAYQYYEPEVRDQTEVETLTVVE